jgi:hypothetical protein
LSDQIGIIAAQRAVVQRRVGAGRRRYNPLPTESSPYTAPFPSETAQQNCTFDSDIEVSSGISRKRTFLQRAGIAAKETYRPDAITSLYPIRGTSDSDTPMARMPAEGAVAKILDFLEANFGGIPKPGVH